AAKKKVAKKTKKTKKKVATKPNYKRQADNDTESPRDAVEENFGLMGGRLAPQNTADTTTNQNEDPSQGFGYWRNLVFSNPSQESSEMLLAAYLQQKIPSDWFYRITDEMLVSRNGILQESSINLLAMTPSNESFHRLSKIVSGRNSQPNLKLLARSSMNDVYKNISYIGILSNSVQNSDLDIAYNAARLIHISAENNLASNARGIANSNTNTFTEVLSILNRVLENATDERLIHFAQLARTYITQHLNSSNQFTADLQSDY
ncbi:MAG: hypothetical protein KDD37_05810, partial [Bdellovibrionales bacterium]|nr:hypothetical protein [Bdellovibrionales bacterium]